MRRVLFVLIFLPVLIFSFFLYIRYINEKNFSIIFFNVGQGDSALIKFENGQKMLVDCGQDKKVLYGLGKSMPFFDRNIDYLLITHFDLDHYGGCVDVLKRYNIKNIIINGLSGGDEYYRAYYDIQKKENAKEKIINEYEKIEIGDAVLEFLWPLKNIPIGGHNENSIVFKLTYVNTSILFVGDLENKGEELLLEKYCFEDDCILNADILKVGHHGSSGSSSEVFLTAVNPKKAILSVGQNTFGHPSRRVIKKLERLGSEILQTSIIGDVVVKI